MFCTTMAVSTVRLCAAALVSALLMMQVKMDADTSVVVLWHLLYDAPVAEQDDDLVAKGSLCPAAVTGLRRLFAA